MKISIIFFWLLLWSPLVFSLRNNVLFFILDDLRPSLRCYGDDRAFTPNIDKIAENGVVFNNCYCQQSLCAPSRNSFLTSRRPDTLHLYDFYSYWRTFAGNFSSLPQYFKENGYHTMSIGKVFHPGRSSNFSDDMPYSWSQTPFHPPTEIYKNAKVCFSKWDRNPHKNLVCPVSTRIQPGGTLPDMQSSQSAISFMENYDSSEKPFFLGVGFHKPHIPLKYPQHFKKYHPLKDVVLPKIRRKPLSLPDVVWNPWTDLRERDDVHKLNVSFPFGVIKDGFAKNIIQSYYASVSYVDHLIGKIMDTLLLKHLVKNTIVVLIGDHGWSLGEHGEWSKYSNFDVATRVPLIIKIPEPPHLSANRESALRNKRLVIEEPVELIDLFPTLVDLVGLSSIKTCQKPKQELLCTQGRSLLPLINDVMTSKNLTKRKLWETFALSQYPRPGEHPSEHPNSDKPKLSEITIMGCSLRTQRFRYTEWLSFENLTIIWNEIHASELYDHEIDPFESLNMIENKTYSIIKGYLSSLLRNNWNS